MKYLLTGIGLILFGLMGCQQDLDVFLPQDPSQTDSPGEEPSISEFFDLVRPGSLQYSWDAAEEKELLTPGGAQVTIPARAFRTRAGQAVSGLIEVELIELYRRGPMLMLNRPTVSDGHLLEMESVFFIGARQNGAPLQLEPQRRIRFRVPIRNDHPEKELFYGDDADPGYFSWLRAGSSLTGQVSRVELYDSTAANWRAGYEFFSDRLRWISCGRFAGTGREEASVCIDLPDGYQEKNTAVFVAFHELNSLVGLRTNTRSPGTFCGSVLPVGQAVSVIVISRSGAGKFYFARRDTTLKEEMTIYIEPEEAAIGTIIDQLRGL